jgi:hypothetical protein
MQLGLSAQGKKTDWADKPFRAKSRIISERKSIVSETYVSMVRSITSICGNGTENVSEISDLRIEAANGSIKLHHFQSPSTLQFMKTKAFHNSGGRIF